MAADTLGPVYKAFHAWLRANRGRIRAPHNKTVIYSGWDKKKLPIWHKLKSNAAAVKALYGVDPKWKSIQAVLEDLPFTLPDYADSPLPLKGTHYGSMWEFAKNAAKHKLVSRHEGQQIWLNLSIYYSKNATGKVWMWVGDTLKEFPDLMLAEIPMLLRNEKITPESVQNAIRLAPKSAEVWKNYRSVTKEARSDGR